MPELFHERGGKSYWRCAWCAEEREQSFPGSYVRVGNLVHAIVCTNVCEAQASQATLGRFEAHRQAMHLGMTP